MRLEGILKIEMGEISGCKDLEKAGVWISQCTNIFKKILYEVSLLKTK